MEIEAKFRVKDFSGLEKALSRAEFVGEMSEEDVYYDLGKEDRVLRLRIRDMDGRRSMILTLKIKKNNKGVMVVDERECEVGEGIAEILEGLGFKQFFKKSKKRRTFVLDGVSVNLDDVDGLGKFVELEFIGDQNDGEIKLKEVARKLGLDWDERIVDTYMAMLQASERKAIKPEKPKKK